MAWVRRARDAAPLVAAGHRGPARRPRRLLAFPLVFDGNLDGAVELATTFVVTFVYVWLFNRTGGSTLLVIVFHSAEGLVQENAFGATGADLARSVWLTLGVWTAVALAVVVFDRAAWRRPGVQAERPVPSVRESAAAATP